MGSARGTATVACARCLDDFQVDLNVEVEGYFLLSEDGPAPEDMDDDEFEVLGADKVLDLEPLIIAALLVEAPLVPLCREDCAGLCAQCGANLNEGPCACSAQPDDGLPRMSDGRVSPFAALKDLESGRVAARIMEPAWVCVCAGEQATCMHRNTLVIYRFACLPSERASATRARHKARR